MLIPLIVGFLKINSAKKINQLMKTPGHSVWQRNYFERIIRNEYELDKTREYIRKNRGNWLHDRNYK